jgi:hypothetical protein
MSVEATRPVKTFSVGQANATLPLVRQITRDVVQLSRDMEDRRQRLTHITSGRDMSSGDPYDDELAEGEGDLTEDAKRLMGYAEELRQLGVELKSPIEGLVDFPAIVGGELAYLCWKFDEPEIQFWHTPSGGFAGRQPIPREHELTDATSQSIQA